MLFGNSISTPGWNKSVNGELSITENNVFGIMNYAFISPVHQSQELELIYWLHLQHSWEAENEIYVPPKAGYISAGLTYYIDLRPE